MASRNRMLFSSVSCEVKPVRRPTARGGKKMLQRVIVRRLRKGRRIVRVVSAVWCNAVGFVVGGEVR